MGPQLLLPGPQTSGQPGPALGARPAGSALLLLCPHPCPQERTWSSSRWADSGVKVHTVQVHIKCSLQQASVKRLLCVPCCEGPEVSRAVAPVREANGKRQTHHAADGGREFGLTRTEGRRRASEEEVFELGFEGFFSSTVQYEDFQTYGKV